MFIHHLAGDRAQSDAEEFRPTVYDDNLSLSLQWLVQVVSSLQPISSVGSIRVKLGLTTDLLLSLRSFKPAIDQED